MTALHDRLHDRLTELAEEAPVALPAPGLWERGRRYRKVRRAGTAAIVVTACLAILVLSGVTWQRSIPPAQPAPAGSSVGLPDRIWSPSPWLPGTDDTGAPGRLVALVDAQRGGWWGKKAGVVGISAATGDYTFLDLPDAQFEVDFGAAAALSPDGRHVAYWLTGATTGPANTELVDKPVVGVAVYDTATGKVRRSLIPTEHGLYPDVLLWADASRLVFSAGQIVGGPGDSDVDQGSSRTGAIDVWSLDDGEPQALSVPHADGSDVVAAADGRLLVNAGRQGSFQIVDAGVPTAVRHVVITDDISSPPVLDPGGHLVAVVAGASRVPGVSGMNPNAVLAGPLTSRRGAGSERAAVEQIPHSGRTFRVLSWLDDAHLAVVRRTGASNFASSVYRVTVATGASEELVRLPDSSYGGDVRFAADLLSAPSVHAEPPPSPLDPRVVAGLAVGTLAAAVGGVVLWRRRVRP